MLALAFLGWWYTTGWLTLARKLRATLRRVEQSFSVGLLTKTLFSPWKRITSSAGQSAGERLRALVDNAVSRLVGAAVRLLTLLAALISWGVVLLLGGVALVAWPFGLFLPLLFIALAVR